MENMLLEEIIDRNFFAKFFQRVRELNETLCEEYFAKFYCRDFYHETNTSLNKVIGQHMHLGRPLANRYDF